jgi:hypothetical protein
MKNRPCTEIEASFCPNAIDVKCMPNGVCDGLLNVKVLNNLAGAFAVIANTSKEKHIITFATDHFKNIKKIIKILNH